MTKPITYREQIKLDLRNAYAELEESHAENKRLQDIIDEQTDGAVWETCGKCEGLEGDVDRLKARVRDLEAVISNALHQAARIFASTGSRDITAFCNAHFADVINRKA